MQLCTRFRFCMGTGALIILVATRTMGGSIQSNRDISRDLQGPTDSLTGCPKYDAWEPHRACLLSRGSLPAGKPHNHRDSKHSMIRSNLHTADMGKQKQQGASWVHRTMAGH